MINSTDSKNVIAIRRYIFPSCLCFECRARLKNKSHSIRMRQKGISFVNKMTAQFRKYGMCERRREQKFVIPNKTAFAIKLRCINVVPSSPLPQGLFFLVLPRRFSDSKVFIRGIVGCGNHFALLIVTHFKNLDFFENRCCSINKNCSHNTSIYSWIIHNSKTHAITLE